MRDYLKSILSARVYDVATESPLEYARALSKKLAQNIYLKREDLQKVFSFKLRGAYNRMVQLSPSERAAGVICASAGNHAQGVALSAQKLGCRAVIVMPLTAPQVKVDAVRTLGGEVVLFGDSYSDAFAHAKIIEAEENLTFIHPFNDPAVIAGQGTIAVEILRQHPDALHAIFVPIGGGGLIAGVAAYVKQIRPDVRIIGVQSVESNAMEQSLRAGYPVSLNDVALFCDGTAVKQVGDETFRLTQQYVDDILTVDNDAVCAAIKDVFADTRSILEPSGALAVAGLKAYIEQQTDNSIPLDHINLVAITSGANMNFSRLGFVAERAEIGEAREALFAVTIPESPGSFKRLCEVLGPRNVTEFNYRIRNASEAHLFVGVQVASRQESKQIHALLEGNKFTAHDLTHDELSKQHLRHLSGGSSPLAQNERVFLFEFPERPGALLRFLSHMAPGWNISLFHYRNQGGDTGRILVGLQVPEIESIAFEKFLATLGYPWTEVINHPAYQFFLG